MDEARARYLRDRVLTATPAQRVVMLYDRLGLDLTQAVATEDAIAAGAHIGHASQVVAELLGSLDVTAGGPADNLAAIYGYLLRELTAIRIPAPATNCPSWGPSWPSCAQPGPPWPKRAPRPTPPVRHRAGRRLGGMSVSTMTDESTAEATTSWEAVLAAVEADVRRTESLLGRGPSGRPRWPAPRPRRCCRPRPRPAHRPR